MILSHTPKCYACFVYDSLSKNRFQEKSSKEMKDNITILNTVEG